MNPYMAPELLINYIYEFFPHCHDADEVEWTRSLLVGYGQDMEVLNTYIKWSIPPSLWPKELQEP